MPRFNGSVTVRAVRRTALLFAAAIVAAAAVLAAAPDRTPRLIVLLVVDQFRGDYIDRYQAQWSQGLKRLAAEGAWFRQAEYPYANTVTCAGHASVSTGALPATHGMILNSWWERATGREVTCTDDPTVTNLGYGKPVRGGDSLARLEAETLADELHSQLSPGGRSISFSLKGRSALTLGGRRPDAVAWFDASGTWVTSTAASVGLIPEVQDFISRNPVENDLGKVWDRTLAKSAYMFEDPAVGITPPHGMTATFPHRLSEGSTVPDASFYDRWQSSPFSDD